jgi:2-octaprenyl-6-methoxyphenol hydroxylase
MTSKNKEAEANHASPGGSAARELDGPPRERTIECEARASFDRPQAWGDLRIHDVAIAGAGPVGATLALALADARLDVVVADARAAGETRVADRTLALSHGARLIFERLHVWTPLASMSGAVTPITAIDVSQAGGFGAVQLSAAEQRVPALGYVVSYRALAQVLDSALARAGVDVRYGAPVQTIEPGRDDAALRFADGSSTQRDSMLRARLAVVADGTASSVPGVRRRRHDYDQVAVVATIALARPHRGVAFERFTRAGPIALLPRGGDYALIWTRSPADIPALLGLRDEAFLAALSAHFGGRFRGFAGVSERRAFPLALEVAETITAARTAVIGNAAQALHPIAGQGFNLGLRDAFELAQAILDSPRDAIGSKAMLARYRAGRERDRRAGIAFTHGLVRLFGNDAPWLRVPRGVGMMLLDAMPFAKRAFARTMLYGMH